MFAETRRNVGDALKRRDVRSIVYFHCDHFEPWRGHWGDVSEKNANDILEFSRAVENVDYAKKLTLFYKCNNYICVNKDRQQLRAEGDEIGFAIPTARETNVARVAMEHIAHQTGHEIQVHYHHEFFTGNDMYCMSMPATREFFKDRNTPALDGKRWEIGLSLALETIRLEANISLENWFFIHGNWALNGSDRDVCTIADEMQRLQKLGCLGDFTFPAGRPHCDPRYAEPVFVRPIEGLKSYDLPEAEAADAYGNGAAAEQGKFFIWSSAIKANASSIDYYSPEVRKRCEDVPHWIDEILEKAVVKGGTLFVKTHSHSMYSDYFLSARRPIPPHLYPGVQNVLCTLFDGAADAGITTTFETVSEVYHRFIGGGEAGMGNKNDNAFPVPVKEVVAAPIELSLGAASTSYDIQELKDEVNDIALKVMRGRIRTLGSQGAGAYAYYEALVKNGRLIQPYEFQIAEYLTKALQPGDSIIEVGCGLGTLMLLLAAVGRKSFGIEGDRRRIDSFIAIRDAIGQRFPKGKVNSKVVPGFFPDQAPIELPRDAALLFTNTVFGLALEKQRAVISAAAEYSWILFDAQRFFIKREKAADIQQLLEMFVEGCFSPPVLVLDLGDSGQYYRTHVTHSNLPMN